MNWKKELLQSKYCAAIATFIVGILVHLFGLLNILHNYDDIAVQPTGYGTGVTSGRWLLSLLGDFFGILGGNYNLPLVNGVLFLLLLAVSSYFLISIFHITDLILATLLGSLLAVFPSAFSTMVFRYTAPYYGIAILFSVLAVWILSRHRLGLFLSALFTACSLGIYQAYVPITIGIFVLLLLQQSLDCNASFRTLVLHGVYYCFALLLGLVLYFILTKLTLAIYCTELSNYQGVNEMGKLSLNRIPELLKETVYSFIMLPLNDYCGLASSAVLKAIYCLMGLFSAFMLLFLWWNYTRKPLLVAFGGIMCLLFPISVNFIKIMCPDSWIYTLMVYAFVLIPFVPAILLEHLSHRSHNVCFSRYLPKVFALLLSAMVCFYGYQTNIQYTALYYANRQTENYLNSMVIQIRMTEGFDPNMEWAFIGEMEDPLLHNFWQYEMYYGGIEPAQWMVKRYSWAEWIRNYYGYSIPLCEENKISELQNHREVISMPCWPADGSIKIINNTVVVKLRDTH